MRAKLLHPFPPPGPASVDTGPFFPSTGLISSPVNASTIFSLTFSPVLGVDEWPYAPLWIKLTLSLEFPFTSNSLDIVVPLLPSSR